MSVYLTSQLKIKRYNTNIWRELFLKFYFIALVPRKVMVLDLDETLIHSHHDG